MSVKMRITYKRSTIGRHYKQERTIAALGFSKLNQSRVVDWNDSIKGMTNKVRHLLEIEQVEESSSSSDVVETVEDRDEGAQENE